MAAQVLWILLTLIKVVHLEQPVFVPSAAELSDAPPENKQYWLHTVIFEPQNKIQVTHAPFMNGFRNVQNYIKGFKADVSNPAYFSKIKHKSTNMGSSPLLDEQDLEAFMQSAYCQQLPYACMTRIKIDRFLMGVDHLDELFDVVYRKFLNAIDHIEYHPTLQGEPSSEARGKCSILFSETSSYSTFGCRLMLTEELFLDKLLAALENMNSTLMYKFKRMKRYSILTWVLGWGVFSNAWSISKIKQNLQILLDQNLLQDKQIKALANHLNLTMVHVNRHKTMLYKLDSKLMILNRTLQNVMVQLSYFRYENNLIDNMQMRINHIYTAIYALKEDIDALYEYKRVLPTQQLNPLIMHPDIFHQVLNQVRDGICSNA